MTKHKQKNAATLDFFAEKLMADCRHLRQPSAVKTWKLFWKLFLAMSSPIKYDSLMA